MITNVGKRIASNQEAVMRRLLVVLGLIASVSSASAADYDTPVLRGSEEFVPAPPAPTYVPRWAGFYAGVQAGYSSSRVGFGSGVGDLAAFAVRDTVLEPVVKGMTTLQNVDTSASSFGGYFGYNSKWESLILGFEVNYSHMALQASSTDSNSLTYSNDTGAPPGHHFIYPLTVSGSSTVRVTDLATFRARAGWTMGQFLPYAFVGVAVARADVARSATVKSDPFDNPDPSIPAITPITFSPILKTESDVKNGGFYVGYAAGIGLEFEIMPRVIARGEWEYVELPNVKNTGVSINTVRAGLGYKF
jgi:opacity protein-like surface antigen